MADGAVVSVRSSGVAGETASFPQATTGAQSADPSAGPKVPAAVPVHAVHVLSTVAAVTTRRAAPTALTLPVQAAVVTGRQSVAPESGPKSVAALHGVHVPEVVAVAGTAR